MQETTRRLLAPEVRVELPECEETKMHKVIGMKELTQPENCITECTLARAASGVFPNEGVRHGGSLVDSSPFVRRVTGSNPALAATLGPWASPSLAVACGASA